MASRLLFLIVLVSAVLALSGCAQRAWRYPDGPPNWGPKSRVAESRITHVFITRRSILPTCTGSGYEGDQELRVTFARQVRLEGSLRGTTATYRVQYLGYDFDDLLPIKLFHIPLRAVKGSVAFITTGDHRQLDKIFVVDLISRITGGHGYTRFIAKGEGYEQQTDSLNELEMRLYDKLAPRDYFANLYNWTAWFSPFLGTGQLLGESWVYSNNESVSTDMPIHRRRYRYLDDALANEVVMVGITGLDSDGKLASTTFGPVESSRSSPPNTEGDMEEAISESEQPIDRWPFDPLPSHSYVTEVRTNAMLFVSLQDGTVWRSRLFDSIDDIPRHVELVRGK